MKEVQKIIADIKDRLESNDRIESRERSILFDIMSILDIVDKNAPMAHKYLDAGRDDFMQEFKESLQKYYKTEKKASRL